jgi:predicted GNAT family acetyltransferase
LRDKINAEYAAKIAAVEARSSVSVRGRDIRADSMAAVGGMVGASRAGAGVADKMLQKAIEDARRQEEIRKLNQEQADRLAELVDRASGGGV